MEALQKQLDNLRDPNHDTSGGSELIGDLVNQNILENTLKKVRENETLMLREEIKNMEAKMTNLQEDNFTLNKNLEEMEKCINEQSIVLKNLQEENEDLKL